MEFSFSNYAENFDDHIGNSIRGYSDLRSDVVSLSKYFVENDTTVLDIGCSQGTILKQIRENSEHAPKASYVGIDVEEAFQKHWTDEDNLKFLIEDVRTWNGMNNLSLVVSMFTMQFIPERDRLDLLKKIYDGLVEGGAFIFSEKVFSDNPKVDDMLSSLYYDFKRESFTEKEILDKEKRLRCLAKLTNESLLVKQLRSIGFRGVQQFWRNFNFVGFVALKLPKEQWGEVEVDHTVHPQGSRAQLNQTINDMEPVFITDGKVPRKRLVPFGKKSKRWENLLPDEVAESILLEREQNDIWAHDNHDVEMHGIEVSKEWAENGRRFPDEPDLQLLFDNFIRVINGIRLHMWPKEWEWPHELLDDIDRIPSTLTKDNQKVIEVPLETPLTGEGRVRVQRDILFQKLWDDYGDRYKEPEPESEIEPQKRPWWKFW